MRKVETVWDDHMREMGKKNREHPIGWYVIINQDLKNLCNIGNS
jgi:hypothetical protein